MKVEDTLKERAGTHGDFAVNAAAAQILKRVCRRQTITALNPSQREAIDNICQKLARILTGNPNHADNWHDIAGYAMLVEKELTNEIL